MKKTRHSKKTTSKSRTPMRGAKLARLWLLAQPDFQRMMLTLHERFAELIVAKFVRPEDESSLEELVTDTLLIFWNDCHDEDILAEPLLVAVRELELDILQRGQEVTWSH